MKHYEVEVYVGTKGKTSPRGNLSSILAFDRTGLTKKDMENIYLTLDMEMADPDLDWAVAEVWIDGMYEFQVALYRYNDFYGNFMVLNIVQCGKVCTIRSYVEAA